MAFLQGFFNFWGAERGELHGKTWWICGGSVVEITSKSIRLKHANFFALFFNFFCGIEGRPKRSAPSCQRFSCGYCRWPVPHETDALWREKEKRPNSFWKELNPEIAAGCPLVPRAM
jgi:hypothetical protein